MSDGIHDLFDQSRYPDMAARAGDLVGQVRPLLMGPGSDPSVTGMALAHLMAMWLAAFHCATPAESRSLRQDMLDHQVDYIENLLRITEIPPPATN